MVAAPPPELLFSADLGANALTEVNAAWHEGEQLKHLVLEENPLLRGVIEPPRACPPTRPTRFIANAGGFLAVPDRGDRECTQPCAMERGRGNR